MKAVRTAALLGAGALAVYAVVVRPRILTWGATAAEHAEVLPGEDVVPHARVRSTRAINVDAPAASVWPWLNQIGQDRGGLYSATAMQNLAGLKFRNADAVHPEWQLRVGDLVRFVPAEMGDFGMTVLRSDPPELLVLGPGPEPGPEGMPAPVWIFSLRSRGDGSTRIVVRFASDYRPSIVGHFSNKWLLEPVHFAMERSMLRGLQCRAASRH